MAPRTISCIGWQNGQPGILLLIYKQPGANVIETVQRVEAHAAAGAAVGAAVDQGRSAWLDRTTTIKASVHDVEFTLLLTIALVVMVIFLFLRNAWATIIPGRHRAAVAARHRGADVRWSATASTICR